MCLPKVGGGLLGKLNEAAKLASAGNIAAAEAKLRDFIALVDAQTGKALTPEQAAMLTAYAYNVIALI